MAIVTKKPKRKRILRGVLMASTNIEQQSCIDVLVIIENYQEGFPFKRLKRFVEHNPTANDLAGIPAHRVHLKAV